ncbi:hypothetical protein MK805_08995 [Shimazuella sp. AN120528]|uniref:hypothetical protein n=1 Tax=Shimazuella soli TaxID=1892854 RepID=UPI001F0E52F6|nr:hypothetical protein [Shimazuella soli]MCH5585106.1 hypothetical protein [Shimazuella soli]
MRLSVEGNRTKVSEFMEAIKKIPQWRFYQGSKVAIGGDELRIDYFFDEKPAGPSLVTNRASTISLSLENGSKLEFVLLDTEVANMGNGITYVHGKSYDIFADSKERDN